jgi:hypothetical protein
MMRSRIRRPALSLTLIVIAAACRPVVADSPLITPEAAYLELERKGYLGNVRIAGAFDLARLRGPADAQGLTLRDVEVQQRLHASGEVPAVAVRFDGSTLNGIDLRDARIPGGLAIENSTVRRLARFDRAQFGGPFVLHGTTFEEAAAFRGTRFAGPVEVVQSTFSAPAGATGGVSFADARFAATAQFNWSRFASDVSFEASRFEGDASFLGLVAPGIANWRNVTFVRDAEFRSCRLGDADFGDEQQMSVFGGLADFRGCTMRSLRLDYVDARGDVMLVNVRVEPGDLSLRQAVLRGARSDFSGLDVAGRLEMEGTHVTSLHFRWSDVAGPLQRSTPCAEAARAPATTARCSDVVRPLQRRLETLKQDDEAREASAMLAEHLLRERLGRHDIGVAERAILWLERVVWGHGTGYGTQLGRIALLALGAWLLLSVPIWLWPRLRVGRWAGKAADAPPRHRAAPPGQLHLAPASALDRFIQRLGFSFGLVFSTPGLMLRAASPGREGLEAYLFALRGVGAVLLALLGLTLANVSPVIRAIVGTVVR